MSVLRHGIVPPTATGYNIERSLRFNSADSAYLNRTPGSAGNRRTFTWSGWVKRSSLGAARYLFVSTIPSNETSILFTSSDTLQFYLSSAGVVVGNVISSAVYRDPSAWYHIVVAVDTTQATSSNRVKLYVNGEQITALGTATYPSQNTDGQINSTNSHTLGFNNTANTHDGYLADVHFIDGQALTPSSFGENDTDTGVWKPKAYTGSYGTNGFKLTFSDNSNTTAATLGKDTSGNGNNWTPNNFSVTAGAGNDSLVDTPTQYGTDTGAGGEVRGNYATLNPLDVGANISNAQGNLYALKTATGWTSQRSTLGISTGKWYFEGLVTGNIVSNGSEKQAMIGVGNSLMSLANYIGVDANGWSYNFDGLKINNGTSSYGTAFTGGDVISVAVDMDAGKIWFAKNGTWQASGNPASGTNAAFTNVTGTVIPAIGLGGSNTGNVSWDMNFGQRPFAYTAPSGFKALCTTNLPTPAIGATSTTRADDYFNTVLYTGTGSQQTVTGVGFQPDFTWVKSRNNVTNHIVQDAVRGATKILIPNATNSELTGTQWFNGFASDGFIVGSDAASNQSGYTYVAWNWKANGAGSSNTAGSITSTVSANTTAGFSIVTYTGTGASATVGHGLGVAPRMIIVKARNFARNWNVYHGSLGATQGINLNATGAATTDSGWWNNTAPTSTVFTAGSYSSEGTVTYVAYCFAEVAGYSRFGSYTGNGSADGPMVFTDFKPAYVMIKQSSASGEHWTILDNKRNTYNVINKELYANLSNAEGSNAGNATLDFLSNGFKIRTTNAGQNTNGATYIYAAFASDPFKYSLAA